MATPSLDGVTLQTLNLLEWRLKRLEFVLNGSDATVDESNNASGTVAVAPRMQKLEQSLRQLANKSDVASDLLKLHSRHPEMFSVEQEEDESMTELDSEQKLSMVLAEAPAYQEMASQLRSLNDLSLPPTLSFTNWASLQPRIDRAAQRQYEQAMEISELRKRSGAVVLKWHEVFVLGQGRCWVEWDERLRYAEREVRRVEVRRGQDEG